MNDNDFVGFYRREVFADHLDPKRICLIIQSVYVVAVLYGKPSPIDDATCVYLLHQIEQRDPPILFAAYQSPIQRRPSSIIR